MDQHLVRNLMESIMLTVVTLLVHSLTLYEACILCVLFVSVLVTVRGIKEPVQTKLEERRTLEPMGCRYHAAGIQTSKFYAVA